MIFNEVVGGKISWNWLKSSEFIINIYFNLNIERDVIKFCIYDKINRDLIKSQFKLTNIL